MRISQLVNKDSGISIDILVRCQQPTCSEADVKIFEEAIGELPSEFWVLPNDALGGRSPLNAFISQHFPVRSREAALNRFVMLDDQKRAFFIVLKLLTKLKPHWHLPVSNDLEPLLSGGLSLIEWVYRKISVHKDVFIHFFNSIVLRRNYSELLFDILDHVRLASFIFAVYNDTLTPIWLLFISSHASTYADKLIDKMAAELADLPEAFWVKVFASTEEACPRTLFEYLLYKKILSESLTTEKVVLLKVLERANNKKALIERIAKVHDVYHVWENKLYGAKKSHNLNYQQLFSDPISITFLKENPSILLSLIPVALHQDCKTHLEYRLKRFDYYTHKDQQSPQYQKSMKRKQEIQELIDTLSPKIAPVSRTPFSQRWPSLLASENTATACVQRSADSGSDTETDEEWQALKRPRV